MPAGSGDGAPRCEGGTVGRKTSTEELYQQQGSAEGGGELSWRLLPCQLR